MPELPEVETVRRGLAHSLEGRRLVRVTVRRSDLRIPLPGDFATRLEGQRVTGVGRRAKYLLLRLEGGTVVLAHLGMSGRIVVSTGGRHGPVEPHDHILLETEDGVLVRFNDARRFGLVTLVPEAGLAAHPLLAALGPEPLDDGFDGPSLAQALRGKRSAIKAALLDQRIVAGLGNIYACETLHRAGISPRRLARTVQGGRAARLAVAIRAVLTEAIAAGGSSLRDYVQATGELGYFQHAWAVYGREGEPCRRPGCAGTIRRLVQANRSTFYCAACQR